MSTTMCQPTDRANNNVTKLQATNEPNLVVTVAVAVAVAVAIAIAVAVVIAAMIVGGDGIGVDVAGRERGCT
jgi:UDP-N-acetyl-D-mannosaminuronic acid transferase (WecB/TagA/CpsF family)